MKKLFICVMTSLCSTFAFAEGELVVNKVTIPTGGSNTMEVVINNPTTFTAFQFDLKLPKGISVSDFSVSGSYTDRKYEKAQVDATTNTWRILSYDEKNSLLSESAKAKITLTAAADAEAGEAETEAIVLVDPSGNSTEVGNGPSANVDLTVSFKIGSSEMTTYVCSSGLDFTGREEKAYVVSGIVDNAVLITRVYKVPAGTPIVVKGSEGTHTMPGANVTGLYYKNLLIGNNSDASINVTPEGGDQFLRLTTEGFQRFSETKSVGAHKAYVRAKALPEPKSGSAWPLTIGSGKRTSLCANVDLDFTSLTNLKAYIAMGYNGSVLITPVKKVSAGTPLYIKGPAGTYEVPSVATQTVYESMLVGNNKDESITINQTKDEYTNLYVSTAGFSTFTGTKSVSAHKSYLQILTSYMPATSRGFSDGNVVVGETETETLAISLGSLGENDGEKTSIRSIGGEVQSDDAWYNLKGQRIDTPTKKGLYIKNGKKVVVR